MSETPSVPPLPLLTEPGATRPSFLDPTTFRALLTALTFVLAVGFIYMARRTLVAFLFAILFAYLLEPLMQQLQRALRLTRARAIGLIYLFLLLACGLSGRACGPVILREGQNLAKTATALSAKVSSGSIAQEIGQKRGWSWQTQDRLRHLLQSHATEFQSLELQFASYAAQIASHIWWFILIPILAIFFLLHGENYGREIVGMVKDRRQRAILDDLLGDIHQILASYIRSQLLLTVLATLVYNGGLWAMQMPYAFALGSLAGVLEFIPVIGPLVGNALIIGTAILIDYPHILGLLAFLGSWRLVQDYVVAPRIMGKGVALPPLAIIFGALVGAEMAGVIGVYLSIPVMATLRVVVLRWYSYRRAVEQSHAEAGNAK